MSRNLLPASNGYPWSVYLHRVRWQACGSDTIREAVSPTGNEEHGRSLFLTQVCTMAILLFGDVIAAECVEETRGV